MDYEFRPVPDDWIDVDHPHLRIGPGGSLVPVDPGHSGYEYDPAPGGPDWNPEDDMRETEAHGERDANKSFESGMHDFGMSERASARSMIDDREMIWTDYVSTGEATVEYGRAYDKAVEEYNRLYNPDEEIPKSKETGYCLSQTTDKTEVSDLQDSAEELNDSIMSDGESVAPEVVSREERNAALASETTECEPDFGEDAWPKIWDSVLLGGPPFSGEFDFSWLSDEKIGLLREALILPSGDVDLRSAIMDGLSVPTVPEWVSKWKDSARDAESALIAHMGGDVPR